MIYDHKRGNSLLHAILSTSVVGLSLCLFVLFLFFLIDVSSYSCTVVAKTKKSPLDLLTGDNVRQTLPLDNVSPHTEEHN